MPRVTGIAAPDRVLIACGVALFLLGLLTGLAVPMLPHPRLGLSGHLEGLMNGLFLILLGLVWPRLSLPAWAGSAAFYAAAYAGFANWAATLLASVWGAAGLMPISGMGAAATGGQEMFVAALLVTLALAMILACGLVLWGLLRRPERS